MHVVEATMATGRHSLRWNVRDERNRDLAAGVYRLILKIGGKRLDRSLHILK
jgi:hypothetical protein